jgi:hypothetical protein
MNQNDSIALGRFYEQFDQRHDELRRDLLARLPLRDHRVGRRRILPGGRRAVAAAGVAAACLVGIVWAAWLSHSSVPQQHPIAGGAVSRPAPSKPRPMAQLAFSLFDLVLAQAKWGFMNQRGEIVVKARFEKVGSFSEGLAAIRLDGKWGFIDGTGKIVIKPQFTAVKSFHEGIAGAAVGKKWGYIDMTGKQVIVPRFDWVYDFADGRALVKVAKRMGVVDRTGQFVLQPQYADARSFSGGLAPVKDHTGRWGLIDQAGNYVVPPKFEKMAWGLHEGLAAFGSGGKWGYFDRTGRVVVKAIYDDNMRYFAEGLARVKVGKKYGYIDSTGRVAVELKYSYASEIFSEGLALVREKSDGPWHFINRAGAIVFTVKAEAVSGVSSRFSSGMVWFRVGFGDKTRYGFMDRTGGIVIPAQFEHIGGGFSEGLAPFASGLNWNAMKQNPRL